MASLLPQSDGYLPYFLLLLSIMAITHSVVCYLASPDASLKQFSGPKRPPPEALTARLYGLKNVYTGLIRLYAAYDIHNPALYDLALCTFLGVTFLYTTEMLIYRTSRPRELVIPFINCSTAIVWMLSQRSWYLS
ncbi:hypothetical protein NKR23_g7273 [Pleurostoma richardsiae]|uniref:Ergosterol biosynthetic protein 28 n=1 Tax=Pleurostoma richardsiae TaxID=41990 RepID=A0AA38VGZ0_9PEZI|nr:hypothetical protein NKR23_g7273 [Pleurostoma richardsiae]